MRMAEKTNWMMEKLRIKALNATIEKFKVADKHYYETCEGGREVGKLINEMYELGMSVEEVFHLDMEIRNSVFEQGN